MSCFTRPFFLSGSDVEIRELQGDEVYEALRLLHEVCVLEQGWEFDPSNPSGLEVREDADGPYLFDSFVEHAT